MGAKGKNLGKLDSRFADFLLKDGVIWTPTNYPVTPGMLYAIPLRMQLLAELERELAELRNELAQPRQLFL